MKKILTIFLIFIIYAGNLFSQNSLNIIKIGLLVPLKVGEGYFDQESIGKDILDGVNFAVDEFNRNSKIKIELVVKDTKIDTNLALKYANELSSDKNVYAIIGPIFSDELLALARKSKELNIPIISPTATGNNIAFIDKYIFQANPDFITRAKALAIYSIKNFNFKNYVCFAPNNSYGKVMVETFSKEINKKNGNILGVEFYTNHISEIQKSINNLCKKIFAKGQEYFISTKDENFSFNISELTKYGISGRIIDSLAKQETFISIYSLLGKDAIEKSVKIGLKTTLKTQYEVDLPINSVDAIYLPITSKNDIKLLAAALNSYKFYAKILGTGDFNNLLSLESTKSRFNGVIFDYDSFIDLKDQKYIDFYRKFMSRNKTQVTKYTLYGFDVASLLFGSLRNPDLSRSSVAEYLSNIKNFPGIHSKVSLNKNRINSNLNILQYYEGKIIKISEISAED